MFELSVAFKYLTPRRRQLSVSLISLISILVITLVVWLIVVFFSVTNGLEKGWIQKLVAVTAPIRITPTEAYYDSYYYQIDSASMAANFTTKSIQEKRIATQTDPYNPDFDGELPEEWKAPDKGTDGQLKDLVKQVFDIAESQQLSATDYEMVASNIRLRIKHPNQDDNQQAFLSQSLYIGSFDPNNKGLAKTLLPLSNDEIAYVENTFQTTIPRSKAFWITSQEAQVSLPKKHPLGEPILLPKAFKDAGVSVGDLGHLSYYAPTASSMQEQRLTIFVAGFYDPGIIPVGGKFALADRDLVSLIRGGHGDSFAGNGIYVRTTDLEHIDQIKQQLQKSFDEAGISPYWKIETFREFDFTKDLLQQLRSEKNLWTLLATVIIIVACSNIISMLIILVNDKKQEIGILRSMGASSLSIAAIFGVCGMLMGAIGSIMGMVIALFTLQHLQLLVDFIGKVQGYQMFNPLFYGSTLPNEISFDAILFVVLTTTAISLVAGIVPAIKASLLKPSTILRSE